LLSEVQQALAALHWRKNEEPLDIFLLGEAPPRIESVLADQGRVHRPGECGQFGGEFGSESEIYWGAIALALDGNVQWAGSSRLNLLPAELRPKRRRWQYAPTYALLGANAVLSAALMMGPVVHRQLLLRQYQQEMGRVAKVATDVDRVQQRQKPLQGRLELLDAFQMHGRQPLDALSEIAQKLTPDAWLTQFSFRQRQIEMVGSAKEAAELLRALQRSPQFEEVKFDGALTRDSSGTEHFRLRMRLKANP
jgi:Tfp pilus assembly protein PilN